VVRGDRFILRAYSPLETIAGGTILDPWPPRRGVRTAAGLARFTRLTESDVEAAMAMVDEAGLSGLPVTHLIGRAGLSWDERPAFVRQLTEGRAIEIGGLLVAASRLSAAADRVIDAVTRYHRNHPLEDGMPREELRERLFAGASATVFDHVLRVLTERKRVLARDRIALAGHSVALTDEEAHARDAMIQMLSDAALTPPDPATLATRLGVPLEVVNRIATLLVRRSVLGRAGDLFFHESALKFLKTEVQALKRNGSSDTIDVGYFKDRFNVTRKYAIPLLEYLDRERVTRRVGDSRKIL
jgi:selenocysteine-specific elongation factor